MALRRRQEGRQAAGPLPFACRHAVLLSALALVACVTLASLAAGQDSSSDSFYGLSTPDGSEEGALWYLKTICEKRFTFYGLEAEDYCYTLNISLVNETLPEELPEDPGWQHRGPGIYETVSLVNREGGSATRPLYGAGAVREALELPFGVSPGHLSPSLGTLGSHKPPVVQRIYPRSGPIEGGTLIHIEGIGFKRDGKLSVKFAWVHEVDVVLATWHNASHITVETPERDSPQNAQVLVSNDGMAYSGWDLATVQGSGTSVLFNFTDIIPDGNMTLDNITGPYLGGTLVLVTLRAYHPVEYSVPYNFTYNRSIYNYSNSPVEEVTEEREWVFSRQENVHYHRFEPSKHLKCKFGDDNTDDEFGHHLTVVPATWVSYKSIKCVSPYTAGRATDRVVTKTVQVTVSNNGVDFGPASQPFTYTSMFPRVFHVFTRHDVYTWKARGPFHGNTEVYINGTQFLPSEDLVVRFRKVPSSRCQGLECTDRPYKIVKCFYDSYIQIRCITPWWDPFPEVRDVNKTLLEPAFLCEVDVSNDGGGLNPSIEPRWSAPNPERFMYSDIYVSPSGSDVYGDHTPRFPFRSISRAIQAALVAPRAYFIVKGIEVQGRELTGRQHRGKRSRGLSNYINSDTIVVQDGTYRDSIGIFGYEKNLYLSPYQRLIEVTPENTGRAFIDCEGRTYDQFRPYSRTGMHEFETEAMGAIVFQGLGVYRCSGNTIWEWLDSKRRYREPVIPEAPCAVGNCTLNGTQCINGTEYDMFSGNKTGAICFDY